MTSNLAYTTTLTGYVITDFKKSYSLFVRDVRSIRSSDKTVDNTACSPWIPNKIQIFVKNFLWSTCELLSYQVKFNKMYVNKLDTQNILMFSHTKQIEVIVMVTVISATIYRPSGLIIKKTVIWKSLNCILQHHLSYILRLLYAVHN